MALLAFVRFCFKNYLRQHRYLRDLIVIVFFIILFEGYFKDDQLQDSIWLVFSGFAVILNILTASSTFFLEKGNTLYFLLSKPNGRKNLFLSKIIVIVLVDLFWVTCFAFLYGLRFLSIDYFLLLPLHLFFVTIILLLWTLMLSLSYTHHPQLSWLLLLLFIFGHIINKTPLLLIDSIGAVYHLLVLLLPPFFELYFLNVSLNFTVTQLGFLALAFIQILVLFLVSYRKMLRKDLL